MGNKVLCVGEVLWDMIPTGKMVGGAPFNVAYHLNKLGIDTLMWTRIGHDTDGEELFQFLRDNKVNTSLVQVDDAVETSKVNIYYDDTQSVRYDIVFPTAWDYLDVPSDDIDWIDTDYLVYGSLIFRHDVSRKSVKEVLSKNKGIKVFDVNFRAPHFQKDTVFEMLGFTDLIKLNEDELDIISGWLDIAELPSGLQCEYILQHFGIKEMLLTLGGKGAMHKDAHSGETYYCGVEPIDIVDTIGSGDSFLAGFLASRLQQKDIRESLAFASLLAGYVTSSKGGCPVYQPIDLSYFEWNNALK